VRNAASFLIFDSNIGDRNYTLNIIKQTLLNTQNADHMFLFRVTTFIVYHNERF